MSTDYYRLRRPFVAITVSQGQERWQIALRDEQGNASTIVVPPEFGPDVCRLLADQEMVIASISWGGDARGCKVTADPELRPDLPLIDEYGDTTTLEQVRGFDGEGRRETTK